MTGTYKQALAEVIKALDKVTLVYVLSKKGTKLSIELNLDNVDVETGR